MGIHSRVVSLGDPSVCWVQLFLLHAKLPHRRWDDRRGMDRMVDRFRFSLVCGFCRQQCFQYPGTLRGVQVLQKLSGVGF